MKATVMLPFAFLLIPGVMFSQKSPTGSSQTISVPQSRTNVNKSILEDRSPGDPTAFMSVDISGVGSWDLLDDPNNTVLAVALGAESVVTGVGWDVTITTVGASWLSEATMYFDGQELDGLGFFTAPGVGNNNPGVMTFSSGGIVDFTDFGISNISIGADGFLYLQFFETFDDVDNALDATYAPISSVEIAYRLNQVALGDSYSSGEGAGAYGDTNRPGLNMCHRSGLAWTSDRPGGDEDAVAVPDATVRESVACSGARIVDLNSSRTFPPYGTGANAEPPQINNEQLEAASVVTLTIGGNDALFAKVLQECSWSLGPNCDDVSFIPDDEAVPLREQVEAAINHLATGKLQEIYSDLKLKVPEGKVYVLGYPRLFGSSALGCPLLALVFQPSERAWLNELADELNQAIECAAKAAGVEFVEITGAFIGHDVCSSQNWIHGLEAAHLPEIFHPNLAGQISYAGALRREIANPKPETCQKKLTFKKGTPPPPEQGLLHVEAEVAVCGTIFNNFVSGQLVRLNGSGFDANASVALRLRANAGEYSASLGSATTGADGDLDVVVQIPADAPATDAAQIKATGMTSSGTVRVVYGLFDLAASETADEDLDGVPDVCDNCPTVPNVEQTDTDGDAKGDLCDVCSADYEDDWDQDGLCSDLDPCPTDPSNDVDGDGFCEPVDGCPTYPNSTDPFFCLFGDGFESGDLTAWTAQS